MTEFQNTPFGRNSLADQADFIFFDPHEDATRTDEISKKCLETSRSLLPFRRMRLTAKSSGRIHVNKYCFTWELCHSKKR
mmetsp:Transcript_17336/g.26264  ORF Transcript_17336/g.26264 Transcript_17336/m.26264 type:complete len:80 (-) Transcript_17336:1363-1602(-)